MTKKLFSQLEIGEQFIFKHDVDLLLSYTQSKMSKSDRIRAYPFFMLLQKTGENNYKGLYMLVDFRKNKTYTKPPTYQGYVHPNVCVYTSV